MPMKKKSTLIFVVKKFIQQSVSDSGLPDETSDDYLTEMESTAYLPSARSIQRILDFASSYDVLDTELTGEVEMNLN